MENSHHTVGNCKHCESCEVGNPNMCDDLAFAACLATGGEVIPIPPPAYLFRIWRITNEIYTGSQK